MRKARDELGPALADAPTDDSWPSQLAWVDAAWVAFSLVNLASIIIFAHWETIPFHFIWISLTLLYGFRVWAIRPTLWVLGMVVATTFAAIGWDVWRGAQSVDELNEVPLMAAMFWLMVWHARRRLAADHERDMVSDENARLLTTQRRFLQDASHQLRNSLTAARTATSRSWWASSPGCAGSASGYSSSRHPKIRISCIPSRSAWTGSPWKSSANGGLPR
jgi:signal transduction histidine kinase